MRVAPAPPKRSERKWRGYLRAFGRAHDKSKDHLGSSKPLLQHLNELRVRVFRALGAVVLTTVFSFIYAEQLINVLALPIGGSEALVSIEVTENIAIFMRVALLSGVVLGMPAVVYQTLRFILPGLKGREGFLLVIGTLFASLLFASGVAFTWFVMIPAAVPFLINFLGITTQVRPNNYFEFITKLMFWIGLSFEMPLVVTILARLKFVTAKQLIAGWRYAVVGIALLAGVITPTVDPVNMGLVALPLFGLYIISIVLAAIAGRK